MDDTRMISARNFEQEIFVIITHLVSDDETVDTEHIIGIGGQRADIFLVFTTDYYSIFYR